MAFGENPKGNFGRRGIMPETRMGTAALLRNALLQAQNYMNRQELAAKAIAAAASASDAADGTAKKAEPPAVDFSLEALAKVLRGELTARIHAHRADDIMTILRIRDEFGFKMTLEHATEAYKVKNEIARRGIPCVTGPSFGSRDKVELRDETFANPGILERAGIKVAITTDAPIVGIEYLRTEASIAHREGMSAAGALRAITLTPAEILGIEDRVGSIDTGKDADLVLLSDEPLSFLSRVERVWVDGATVLERCTWREDWEKN
jgi:imidazolonepropionase-like amidohydrolase